MTGVKTLDVPVAGMDCTECTQHVEHAIAALPGVVSVNVFLTSEKATVRFDPDLVDRASISRAVESAGYSVPAEVRPSADPISEPRDATASTAGLARRVGLLLVMVFCAVLFIVIVGEWLGLFEQVTSRVPWPIGLALVALAGYPVFRQVVKATLRGQVLSHTLMTLGVLAAVAVGQWATALVVVFFMRVGDYVESFTTERARNAVRDLTALAPAMARIEVDGEELQVQAAGVQPGQVVVVRPGESIPVDGEVIGGQATVDQATITGESIPVEAGPGAQVYAATVVRLGHLRVRTVQSGGQTTFGQVVKMVEEAEAHRAHVQRFADRFSIWYLPVVAGLALLTLVLRHDPLAAAAVLVVACSCSVALATPIAVLASIGAAARRGLLIKGGKYLESLARADVLLIDKTGTLTLGQPQITDILELPGGPEGPSPLATIPPGAGQPDDPRDRILWLAASAERYSEHPLAEAVRAAARRCNLVLAAPDAFEALPGLGIRAQVAGCDVIVGNGRMLPAAADLPAAASLAAQGKSLLFVACDGRPAGVLAAADTLRPEVPAALAALRGLGLRRIELLTGDNEATAAALGNQLGLPYQANLLPDDKIRVVKAYQAQGHCVVMVGDGINDAPALAQADTGIAMGAAGSAIAIEAAHVALMRDDWTLVPEVLGIARRTMRVVKMNLGFTAVYNVVGLTLAALGFLPPVLAAAAQSLPDLGILANSSRLLRLPSRSNDDN